MEIKSPMNDPHYKKWLTFYNLWRESPEDTMQYKARCVKGLLDGTTYDYN